MFVTVEFFDSAQLVSHQSAEVVETPYLEDIVEGFVKALPVPFEGTANLTSWKFMKCFDVRVVLGVVEVHPW